jgi:hypothetical protein
MKKSENIHQIPESEITPFQEENSSSVEQTESEIKETQPTESVQTEEEKTAGEFQEVLPPIKEEHAEEKITEENIPAKALPDILAELKEATAEGADETEIDSAGQIPDILPETNEENTEEVSLEELNTAGKIPELLPEIKEEHAEDELSEEMADHEAHELDEDFNTLSREQLVGELEKAVNEPDLNVVKTRIALIKVAFLKKKKEENLQQYEKFAAEDGHKEVAPAVEDILETRFN